MMLVNDYQVTNAQGATISDKGRQWQFGSDYWWPGLRYQVTSIKNTGEFGTFNTGGSGVRGGSKVPYYDESQTISSAIIQDSTRGSVFCARIRPRWWSIPAEYANVLLDTEVWVQGNAVACRTRHIIQDRPTTPNQSQPIYQAGVTWSYPI